MVGCCSTSSPGAIPPSSTASVTGSIMTSATPAPTSSSPPSAVPGRAGRFDSTGVTTTWRGRRLPRPTRTAALLRGASAAAKHAPARHVDVYLTWGEPPDIVAPRLAHMRSLPAADARSVALRHPAPRHHPRSPADAWAETDRVLATRLAGRSPRRRPARPLPVGRPTADGLAARGPTDSLVVSPNLWAGYGLVRGGAGTALVGSHEEVADRLLGVPRASASTSSSSRVTPTSRRRTGSPRASCRSCAGPACWRRRWRWAPVAPVAAMTEVTAVMRAATRPNRR